MRVWSLGWKDALEKELASCSSILAWRIPWTEEPGRLQSMGSQRVRHDRATNIFTFIHLREKTEFPCFTLSLLFRMNGADPFTSPYTPGILLIGEHSVCFPDVKGWRAWGRRRSGMATGSLLWHKIPRCHFLAGFTPPRSCAPLKQVWFLPRDRFWHSGSKVPIPIDEGFLLPPATGLSARLE